MNESRLTEQLYIVDHRGSSQPSTQDTESFWCGSSSTLDLLDRNPYGNLGSCPSNPRRSGGSIGIQIQWRI